ncbi:MAG: 30S ribosomal protein S20 [Candidatus Parcubacteria bacterium]|nr:MAG: 30S ribosomal protein S20 [Candidatus Parcubacteria bacterium]
MPRTRSSKKALKQSLRNKIFNDRRRRKIKQAIKDLTKQLGQAKSSENFAKDVLEEKLKNIYKQIDKGAKRFIHPNKAARLKSKYAKLVSKIK